MKYELWHALDGGSEVYTLLEVGAARHPNSLEKGARVVWTVEAETWEEARRKQHEHLGWEPYKPMPES